MHWILIAMVILVIGLTFYWLFVITEGIYLGRRMVIWLYDITAKKYDDIKQFDAKHERQTIIEPLLNNLAGEEPYWVLDVATGTGRVPALLLNSPDFSGRVVGLDAAGKMLALAASKLATLQKGKLERAALVRQEADALPFPKDTFDAVTCLEALEFLPSDMDALREMVRVIRPGGFLMTTRRRGFEARLFVGRYRSTEQFEKRLTELGLEKIMAHFWQVNYDLVMARKGERET